MYSFLFSCFSLPKFFAVYKRPTIWVLEEVNLSYNLHELQHQLQLYKQLKLFILFYYGFFSRRNIDALRSGLNKEMLNNSRIIFVE